ncbi:MAG TPA: NnrS family protein [Lacipirellulaceae bacterium]
MLSALLITLSLGTGWGAWMLWSIGSEARFQAVSPASITAHGEAQLWGFIGLFILGISLRTVLQEVVRHPLGKWICRTLLALMLLGIAGGFIWFLISAKVPQLGVASAAALFAMAALYWAMQFAALCSKWRATWPRAILASGLWLTVWAVVTLHVRWLAYESGPGAYSSAQRLLLIELAVFGFSMNSIYGFGQKLLPGLLRIGSTRDWAIELSHWAHNIGTLILCVATAKAWHTAVSAAGCMLLAAGAILFVVGHRGFVGRRHGSTRPEQGPAALDLYPPLAFFWLVTSLLLMTGGFLYEVKTGNPLPHAYMGAVRHALTVGFMMTLIMGVAQRLLPVLDRTVIAMPRLVLPILVLIGLGNLLRVAFELAIIATPAGFSPMRYSAIFEWLALVLFTISCVATMFQREPLFKRGKITARSSLAVLLAEHPWIEDRLIARGTSYLGRTRSVPLELTIGSFAESERMPVEVLVSDINAWLSAWRSEQQPSAGHV